LQKIPHHAEESLQAALMSAISETILRDALLTALTDSVKAAACAETEGSGKPGRPTSHRRAG
jgi:hypothetical protein